jgi:esterase/lipase superfamily enzyme
MRLSSGRGLGASLGADHRANIAFRHPDSVSHLISLCGSFEISSFFDGYHDDNIYFNSPFEDLPNTTDPWKYNHMGIDDGKWRGHDWNYWCDMLPYYLSKL